MRSSESATFASRSWASGSLAFAAITAVSCEVTTFTAASSSALSRAKLRSCSAFAFSRAAISVSRTVSTPAWATFACLSASICATFACSCGLRLLQLLLALGEFFLQRLHLLLRLHELGGGLLLRDRLSLLVLLDRRDDRVEVEVLVEPAQRLAQQLDQRVGLLVHPLLREARRPSAWSR
jgi:hypothetical protein